MEAKLHNQLYLLGTITGASLSQDGWRVWL